MAPPRRVRTTNSRHSLPIAPNLIGSNFAAAAPNQVWLADITYIPTGEGWLYLAAVIASMSRRADCFDNAPMESFFHTLKTEHKPSTKELGNSSLHALSAAR